MHASSFMPVISRGLAAVGALSLTVGVALPSSAQDGAEPTITTQVIASFDGTEIFSTLFVPAGATVANPAPLIMRTHGWGGAGETTVSGTLARLLDEGYMVMTWDQRGFGKTGSEAYVDKPEFEGKDASILIDWVVENVPAVAYESAGDPIVGFTGGSYAGGIQTATASIDPRVDAIAPEISWSDLRYSLFENGVVNFGWSQLLFGAGLATASTGGLNPSNETGIETGSYATDLFTTEANGLVFGENDDEASLAFFAASSLDSYGVDNPVNVPALVMNGSVDTLFDLSDGARIAKHVAAQGAPVKFVAFCGGHVSCPSTYADADDRTKLDDLIVNWFAKYLLGENVDTGAPVEYRTNDGEWRTSQDFPTGGNVTADIDASLIQLGVPDVFALQSEGLPLTTAYPSVAGDPQATTVEVFEAAEDTDLLGIPTVTLEVSGLGDTAHLFTKLVHREAGTVVNLQETPLRVEGLLTEGTQTFDLEMSGVAYTIPAGDHLDVQIATNSLMHINARGPASVDVLASVSVPTRPVAAAPTPAAAPTTSPAPAPVASATPAPAAAAPALPATGGGAVLVGLVALVGAGATRRRR